MNDESLTNLAKLGYSIYWEENMPKYLTLTKEGMNVTEIITVAPNVNDGKPEVTSYIEGTKEACPIDFETILGIFIWSLQAYGITSLVGDFL